jgi:hypothetical protein
MLPSSKYRAPDSALRRSAESLATTDKYRNLERPVTISSESPPARAASSVFVSPHLNGSTAIRRLCEETGVAISRAPGVAPVEDCSERLNAMSFADWNRLSRSFSRQCLTMRSRAGETLRPDSDSSGGSFSRIAAVVSALVSRMKAFFPESNS